MNKKLVILVVAVLILGFFVYLELNKHLKSVSVVRESLDLIQQGNYEEGLNKCNQAYYKKGLCYGLYIDLKKASGETISNEFCNEIPTKDYAFWYFNKKSYREYIEGVKEICFQNTE